MIQRVGQGHPSVVRDEVDSGALPAVERRRGKPLGHEHADRFVILLAVGVRFGSGDRHRVHPPGSDDRRRLWPLQGDHRQGRGVRFVDEMLELLLDLRRELTPGIGMPERIAGASDDAGEGLDRLDRRGPALHRFLAADGLESEASATADEDTHAVAADDPPGLIGEHERRRDRVERFVDRPAEAVDLRERGLLGVDRLRLATGEVAARHRRHLGEEGEESLLDFRGVGLVENLEEPGPLSVAIDRGSDEKEIGRVARHRFSVGAGQLGPGGDQHPFGAGEERFDESAMRLLRLRGVCQPGRLDPGVADRLAPPPFPDDPHQPGHGPHRLEDSIEESAEEIGLGEIRPAELVDLRHDRADLLAGLVDGAGINGAHWALNRKVAGWGYSEPPLGAAAVRGKSHGGLFPSTLAVNIAGGVSADDAHRVVVVIRAKPAPGSPDGIGWRPGWRRRRASLGHPRSCLVRPWQPAGGSRAAGHRSRGVQKPARDGPPPSGERKQDAWR